jgi:hypothetical protein
MHLRANSLVRDQGILTSHQVNITLGGQPERALTEGVRPSTFLFMDARSDRDAWNSDRLWAVEQMSGQHWPIELCIAWVAERSKEEAWPAAGFVDTEIGCFMKPEVAYAAKTVWS